MRMESEFIEDKFKNSTTLNTRNNIGIKIFLFFLEKWEIKKADITECAIKILVKIFK